ncbi:hypothetical protein HMPREF9057_02121 [Actinomyces sp. oral taxon 171 str. F0337]|nr:hypothetical protein HMPREF9057_02121 [Actinomyces sp. oral taxon 171 str. F0337]
MSAAHLRPRPVRPCWSCWPCRPYRSLTFTSVSNSHTEGRTGREKGTTS